MSKNKPPAFLFYVKDWLSSSHIALMTPAEEGAYIRLLAHAWADDDCSLPDDEKQLAILSRLGQDWLSYPAGTNPVRNCFVAHPTKKSRLINKRLFADWKKLRSFRKERAESGRKGAVLRWKASDQPHSSANSSAMAQPKAEGVANDSIAFAFASASATAKIKKERHMPPAVDVAFVEFWKTYPARNGKKLGKPEALQKWNKLKPDDRPLVLMAVKHYATSKMVTDGIGIRDPHRWLKHGKDSEPWRDWLEPERPSNGHGLAQNINDKNFHEGVW